MPPRLPAAVPTPLFGAVGQPYPFKEPRSCKSIDLLRWYILPSLYRPCPLFSSLYLCVLLTVDCSQKYRKQSLQQDQIVPYPQVMLSLIGIYLRVTCVDATTVTISTLRSYKGRGGIAL